jgi:hypothetical protein
MLLFRFSNLTISILSICRHYEMLKLHHMNLLNEIQETTLMMNLYQQQQLQQQQQQLQQQATAEGLNSNTSFDTMLGQQHRASLGLGGQLDFSSQQLFLQQQMMPNVTSAALGGIVSPSSVNTGANAAAKSNTTTGAKNNTDSPAGTAISGITATTKTADKKRQTKTPTKNTTKKAKTGTGSNGTNDMKTKSEATE